MNHDIKTIIAYNSKMLNKINQIKVDCRFILFKLYT